MKTSLEKHGDTIQKLKPGDEFFHRYRERGFGPIKKENYCATFLIRELGITRDEIEYWVQIDGWLEAHVSGKPKGT